MFAEKVHSGNNKSSLFTIISLFFLLGGIFGVGAGLIHLASLVVSGFSLIVFGDFIMNTVIGITEVGCYFLLRKRSGKAIWLYSLVILASVVYAFAVGRGLNVVMVIVGIIIIGNLYTLKKQGQIT